MEAITITGAITVPTASNTLGMLGMPGDKKPDPVTLLLFWSAVVSTPLSATAGEWTVTPSVTLSEVFTDNVALAPDGEEEWELITEVSPGVSVRGTGGRLNLALDYLLQNLFFLRESDRNSTNHQLRAAADAELVEEHLFLDMDATYAQVLVDPDESINLDNFNSGNRSDAYSYAISPYYLHDLAGYAEASARYTYRATRYDREASDSDLYRYDLSLSSGRRFDRLQWKFVHYDEDLQRDGDRGDSERTIYQLNGEYQLNSRLLLLGLATDEEYDIDRVQRNRVQSGSYWAAGLGWLFGRASRVDLLYGDKYKSIGITWVPSSRTRLAASWLDTEVGDNIGEQWQVLGSLGIKRMTVQARYSEDTVAQQQLPLSDQFALFCPSDAFPATGETQFLDTNQCSFEPSPGSVLVPTEDIFPLTDEVFIRKRGSVSVAYRAARSLIYVGVFDERREFITGDDEDQRRYGINSSLNWRFSGRSAYLVNGSWSQRDRESGNNGDTYWYLQTGVSHQLSPTASTSLLFRHARRDSDGNNRDYTENRITLQLFKTF